MPGRNNTCITCLHAIAHHHRPTHIHTHTWRPATIHSISHGRYGTALDSNRTAVQCLSVGIRREGLIANAILIDRKHYCEDLQKLINNFQVTYLIVRRLTNIDKTWTFVIEVPTNNNYDVMMFLFRLLWSMMMMCDRFRMSAQKQINVHILTDWGNYLGCTTTCLSIDIAAAAAAMYKFYALT